MSSGNCVRNSHLTALLKDAEKAQSERLRKSLHNFQESRDKPPPPRTIRQPLTAQQGKENASARSKTEAASSKPDEIRAEIIPLTLDEIEWLDEVVDRHGLAGLSKALTRLVEWANRESPEAKKKLFLVVRCRRCSAGAKGGVKRDRNIELASQQWQWLENVRERCGHASTGKTLRIIVDFYMAVCKDDSAFEQKVLQGDSTVETKKEENALASVDASRAPSSPKSKSLADPAAESAEKGAGEPLAELLLNAGSEEGA